jgi:hypothetical protein
VGALIPISAAASRSFQTLPRRFFTIAPRFESDNRGMVLLRNKS